MRKEHEVNQSLFLIFHSCIKLDGYYSNNRRLSFCLLKRVLYRQLKVE